MHPPLKINQKRSTRVRGNGRQDLHAFPGRSASGECWQECLPCRYAGIWLPVPERNPGKSDFSVKTVFPTRRISAILFHMADISCSFSGMDNPDMPSTVAVNRYSGICRRWYPKKYAFIRLSAGGNRPYRHGVLPSGHRFHPVTEPSGRKRLAMEYSAAFPPMKTRSFSMRQ